TTSELINANVPELPTVEDLAASINNKHNCQVQTNAMSKHYSMGTSGKAAVSYPTWVPSGQHSTSPSPPYYPSSSASNGSSPRSSVYGTKPVVVVHNGGGPVKSGPSSSQAPNSGWYK
ncbi:hypothetical protein B0A49_09316, partial [Cryomyces minteri]